MGKLDAQSITFQKTDLSLGTSCAPYAIAVGDFDGDHKTDLAVLCQQQILILLGNGDGTFHPGPAALSQPTGPFNIGSLVAADFNHDGLTDLALLQTTGFGQPNLMLVWMASGNGAFRPPMTFMSTVVFGNPGSAQAADVNGDGFPDLIYISSQPTLFLGRGDGTFSDPMVLYTGILSAAATVADFNVDGKVDIAFSGIPLTGVSATELLLGNGDGTFSSSLVASLGTIVVAGDFNGDGKPDLAIGDFASSSVYGLLGKGDGTFEAPVMTPGFLGSMVAADLNGDGKSDLALASGTASLVVLLVSKGDGSFQVANNPIALDDIPSFLVTADINGDGKPDLAVVAGSGVSILLNTTSFNAVTAVDNGASFAQGQPVAPGSLVSVFGTGFLEDNSVFYASSIPLPTSLGGGVSVTFNGIPAPLLFVSATQINAQVPWDVVPGAGGGTVTAIVTANGKAFPAFQFQVGLIQPAIFSLPSGQAVAINADGSLAGPAGSIPGAAPHPAKVGDPLVILGTGLGAVTPPDESGVGSLDTLRKATTQPKVLIGGVQAEVSFAGLSPQFVGVNQINVVVPKIATPGVLPIQINSGGVLTSDKVTIAVQNP
jgi:uncharacterized protein (TIGR03437 family)